MAVPHVTLLHEWFEEVWNKGDPRAIDRLMADDAVSHGLKDADGNELKGKDGFIPFFHAFRAAFPNLQVEVQDVIEQGDQMVCRCVVRGTHGGDTLGIAATQRPVEFTGMCWVRVRDGQLVEGWNNFDFATMNAQLQAV